MGFTEYNQVEEYYSERLIDIVSDMGSDYIIWQDPVDKNVTVSITCHLCKYILYSEFVFICPNKNQNKEQLK